MLLQLLCCAGPTQHLVIYSFPATPVWQLIRSWHGGICPQLVSCDCKLVLSVNLCLLRFDCWLLACNTLLFTAATAAAIRLLRLPTVQ